MAVTVQGVLLKPDNTVDALARVDIALYGADPAVGFIGSTDTEIVGQATARPNSTTGIWSASLTPNSLITPANTLYKVTVSSSGAARTVYYISVPNGAGPYWVGDIQATVPDSTIAATLYVPAAALSPMKPGNYYVPPFQGTISTRSMSSGNLFATPMWVPACSIDQIAISVTNLGTASEVIRLGIFADSGYGEPSALLVDAGTIAAGTSDGTGVKTATFASTLTISRPSTIWLAAVGQTITTAPFVRSTANTFAHTGYSLATSVLDAQAACYFVAGVTGALPATFGTPTVTTTAPRIAIRIA